jgi:predicted enzyme related to lactoylglutathione lyase
VNAYPCTLDVPDLDGLLGGVAAAGGRTVVPRMPIPGLGWLACCHETEGNLLGLVQADPKAG